MDNKKVKGYAYGVIAAVSYGPNRCSPFRFMLQASGGFRVVLPLCVCLAVPGRDDEDERTVVCPETE